MELAVAVSVIIAIISVFTSCLIVKRVKKQISEMYPWTIDSISLDGTDAYDYTYSYQKQKLYVMKPYQESIINAQERINSTLLT